MAQELQDEAVIRMVLAGRTEAYAVLVDRYQQLAFTLALRQLQQRELAEEATQDAFVKAYRALADFRSQSRFSTWLYTIVYHTCCSYQRLKRPPISTIAPEDFNQLAKAADHAFAATTPSEQRSRAIWLRKAMAHLSETDGMIINLFYQADQSIEDIGRILGLSVSNVKVRLFRARARLRELLTQELSSEARELYLN